MNDKDSAAAGLVLLTLSILALSGIMFLTTVLFTGCTYSPYREFNTEDTQDYTCYKDFGGMQGYCTK